MKLIYNIKSLTERSIIRNMKLEYKNAIIKVRNAANKGNYSVSFMMDNYYENEDDIYFYVIDKLKSKGFKVDSNKNSFGKKFIEIFWE